MATNPPQMPQMPPTPQARFIHCNQQYGTPKSKQFLNFKGYQDALEAANSAKIQPNNLLSLWDNENADQETFPKVGPYGEVGPMQITTSGQNELFSLKQMPSGWNTNAEANLLAGARLFAHILQHHAVSSAAAIYNGGTGGMNSTAAQGYQKTFNANSASFQKLINCMH